MTDTDVESNNSPTSLASLPSELLASIGWHVAPEGGRKAGDLRLVSRALDRAVAPIVWASIAHPIDIGQLDRFFESIVTNKRGLAASVTSVRLNVETPLLKTAAALLATLPGLKRVELVGSAEYPAIPTALQITLISITTIRTLAFYRLQLSSCPPLCQWAGSAVSLSFTDCQGIAVLFEENRYTTFRASKLETICFTGTNTPETGKGELLEAFYYLWAASISGRYIELELAGCRRNETVLAFTRTCPGTWRGHEKPLDLTLRRLGPLFDSQGLSTHNATSEAVVAILNWVGCVTNLSLPVTSRFDVNDHFGQLQLPVLAQLSLRSNSTWAQGAASVDLLTVTTFRNLGKFLSITNLPALKTLQLRGWLDATNAKTVALAPLNTLPSEYLELWGLLGILRNTGVVELRLQNSVGHPDELVECVFRRADRETPEWEKRLATFW